MDEQAGGRVVVGISGSLAGLAALRYAVAEARRRRATLHAVRVWHFNVAWQGSQAQVWRAEIAEEALRFVDEAFADAMGGLPRDIDVSVCAAHGRADLVLAGIARDHGDLIVLGGRAGRRPGWIVRGCTRHAVCPVTVVPPPSWAKEGGRRASARRLVREAARYAGPGG